MKICFVVAQTLCLFWLILKRYQFHNFMVALSIWVIQSAVVTMGPQYGANEAEVNEWLRHVWSPMEIISISWTAVSCFEAARSVREHVERGYHRFVAFSAASGLGIAMVGIVAMQSDPTKQGDWYFRFLHVRGMIWLVLAVYMAVTMLLLLKTNINVPAVCWVHLGLLTAILGAHAGLCGLLESSPEIRALAREVFRISVILGCFGWILNARREA